MRCPPSVAGRGAERVHRPDPLGHQSESEENTDGGDHRLYHPHLTVV